MDITYIYNKLIRLWKYGDFIKQYGEEAYINNKKIYENLYAYEGLSSFVFKVF